MIKINSALRGRGGVEDYDRVVAKILNKNVDIYLCHVRVLRLKSVPYTRTTLCVRWP